jgi:hypothetical protein
MRDRLSPNQQDSKQQVDAVAESEQTLLRELTTLADMCRYFDEKGMQVPPHIGQAIRELGRIPAATRADTARKLNLELMEYLENVSPNFEFRM